MYYTQTLSLQYVPRSTTGPVNFYFIFQYPTELLAHSQEYNTQTPYLSDCAVHRVPLHKSTKDTSI